MAATESVGRLFDRSFPAPEPRQYQKPATEELYKGIQNPDHDVVLLDAPTGSGKSIILYTAARMCDGGAFFTTPINSLVDQMANDDFMSEQLIALKGRNNYDCIHPEDIGKDVDKAICQRDSDFECDVRDECPYYGRKLRGLQHPFVVTNLSYLMAEGMLPRSAPETFGDRQVLIVDECQNIEDFALNFVGFTVSERSVPGIVWQNVELPEEDETDDMEAMEEWVRTEVLRAVGSAMDQLVAVPLKSEAQQQAFEEVRNFKNRIQNFLMDVKDHHWVADYDVTLKKNAPDDEKVVFEPINVGRFLDELLWERGGTVVLSSATIPGEGWLEDIGLADASVKHIGVGSTFPVENRPIYFSECVGKMTYNERDDTIPKMARKLVQIQETQERIGEPNGFVHCRSYGIAKRLKNAIVNHGPFDVPVPDGNGGNETVERGGNGWVLDNVMIQDSYERDKSLQRWIDSDTPMFLSVAMDEGVDLDGDKAHWQALAKTLYPFMGSERVSYRVKELGDWDWYNRKAVVQLQQAYGRGVRSRDDECRFYVLDSSAKSLVQMNAEMFQQWFLEAIQDLKVDPRRGR